MAKSLLEGIDVAEKATPRKSGGDKGKTRMIASVVLLVVAVGLLAWYYLVPTPPPKIEEPVITPQVQKAQQQQQKQIQQDLQSRKIEIGGS
jgi:hypothetical protein